GLAMLPAMAAVLANLPDRRPRLTLRRVCVCVTQEPAEIRIATEIAGDEDELLAVDLEGGADDRLDSELAASLEVAHRAVDAAPVRDRECRHLELSGTHRQLVGM